MVKYILLSDSSSDSMEGENIVKELYECQIIRKNLPAINYGRLGRLNNFPEAAYPDLLLIKSLEITGNTVISGLESIRRYVKGVVIKNYLLVWLTLISELPSYLVFQVNEADFF